LQVVSTHRAELERARHAQQIIPMTTDEFGIDAVASDAIQRAVVSGRLMR
jgi:hypothetical protein